MVMGRPRKSQAGGTLGAGSGGREISVSRLTGILACPLCGRSLGATRKTSATCERCRQEYRPTRLQQWRAAIGWSVAQVAEACGLTPMTVQRGLRGEPLGSRAAWALTCLTDIPAPHFRKGEE